MLKRIKTEQVRNGQLTNTTGSILVRQSLFLLVAAMLIIGTATSAVGALLEIESGTCLPGEIGSPGAMESYTFYGEAGQAVVITATKSSGSLYPEIFLYAPDGTLKASTWNFSQARIEQTLTQTGWQTITVEDLDGSRTGSFNLCLLLIPGATSRGQIDSGQCKTGTILQDMESYTFYGEAGQAVVITATKYSGDNLYPQIFLYAPDGTLETSTWEYSQARIEQTLTQTGWQTITVEDSDGSRTGSFNLCLLLIPGATSRGQIDSGQCKTGNIIFNMESYTFYGEAGQAVVITATKSSGSLYPEIFLYTPDGTLETSTWNFSQARIEQTLTQTGWQTITVEDSDGSRTGSFNLCLLLIPGATSRGQIDSGQCKAGNIIYNMESYTFYGEAGQAVVITATKSSGSLYPEIFLYTPDGTLETSTWNFSQARIEQTLTQTGWQTITVEDLDGSRTGSFGLCLTKIPSTPNPIVNISPQQGEITGPNVLIEWQAPGAIAFDLYCGYTYPITKVAADISYTEYYYPMLEPDVNYIWYVVAKYADGEEVSGPYGWFIRAPCEGDFDEDDDVDNDDFIVFAHALGTWDCVGMGNCNGDFDGDDDIDGSDLYIFLKDYGRTGCLE
jgi:hypothetical protein